MLWSWIVLLLVITNVKIADRGLEAYIGMMIHYKPYNNNWSRTLNTLHEPSPLSDHYKRPHTSQVSHLCHAMWNALVWKLHWKLTLKNWICHFITVCLKQIEWIATLANYLRFRCENLFKRWKIHCIMNFSFVSGRKSF